MSRRFFGMTSRKYAQGHPRSYLEKNQILFLQQSLQAIREAHGVAQMIRPILSAGRLAGSDPRAGEIGDVRQTRALPLHPGDQLGESFPDGIHLRGMKSVRSMQATALNH